MIIGARKKIKAFLMVWLIFSCVKLIVHIYNCIKIGSSNMLLIGINIGEFFLVVISCIPVGLSIYKLDDEEQRNLEEEKQRNSEKNEQSDKSKKFIKTRQISKLDLALLPRK